MKTQRKFMIFFLLIYSCIFFACNSQNIPKIQKIKIEDEVKKSILGAYNNNTSPFFILTINCFENCEVNFGFLNNKKERLTLFNNSFDSGTNIVVINLTKAVQNNYLKNFFIESSYKVQIKKIEFNGNSIIIEPYDQGLLELYYEENNQSNIVCDFSNYENTDSYSEKFTIRLYPNQKKTILHQGAFSEKLNIFNKKTKIEMCKNSQIIKAIIVKKDFAQFNKSNDLTPLIADPGTITTWQKKLWRKFDYEIFSWELLPNVLIFDFATYDIQDKYLKRLAFFVEKSGYVGQLWQDKDINHLHGFNAHDYRSQSLADFFNLALQTNFQLNKEEEHLCSVLQKNNIIKKIKADDKDYFIPLNGAIVSISQESPEYLRRSLLGHECYHGIYFTDEKFRIFVDDVRNIVDPQELAFLHSYFFNTPSLKYNPQDDYLLKNEFMAYLLQQSVNNCSKYFSQTLANRKYVREASPDLCQYIIDTKAKSLQYCSQLLEQYINEEYGLKAGRVFLITKE